MFVAYPFFESQNNIMDTTKEKEVSKATDEATAKSSNTPKKPTMTDRVRAVTCAIPMVKGKNDQVIEQNVLIPNKQGFIRSFRSTGARVKHSRIVSEPVICLRQFPTLRNKYIPVDDDVFDYIMERDFSELRSILSKGK
jgi:hypothetical protein